jgi:aldehyde dehydrogenase (NAD+)
MTDTDFLPAMKKYFESGATKSYDFRKRQLSLLKTAIEKYEREIMDALYKDLRKSNEESYATEIGLVYAEINYALKNLHTWMKPQNASINLVNMPSSAKIYRDALGVVFIIGPWNYPLQLIFIPLAGAVAGGNCAVLKPSEFAPATAAITQKIIEEIFANEYVTVVQGDGAETVPALIRSFRFDYIFYTGSISVGKIIYKMAADDLVPVTLELGGKSPAIVESDANIAVAAKRIVLGKFINAGQTCIAPDYVLVHTSVKDALTEKLKYYIEKFYTENAKESYDYGKIINQKRFDKLLTYLKEGIIFFGGKYDTEKLFISPTLMNNISANATIMKEEIFGPILPIISFETREDALKTVKQNEKPLAFYLFTSNKKTEREWIDAVPFGGGCINNADWHFTNHHLPFGGVGNSGTGAYHGKFTFDTFTRLKPVMSTPSWFDPAIKYPPYKGKLKLFKWLFK